MDRQATYGRARVRTALAAAFFAVSGWAHAAAGDLDATFGGTGVVNVGPAVEQPIHSAARYTHDSIVSAIVGGLPGARIATVYHTLEDGTSDAAFGSGGSTLLAGPVADDAFPYVVADKRNRIVVALVGGSVVRIYRLTTAGLPDATFGAGGVIQFAVTSSLASTRVFTQRDRKILLVTTEHDASFVGSLWELAVRRFNENGTPDATFGTGGVFRWQGPGPSTRTWGAGLGVQADGRVIVSGRYGTGGGAYTGYVLRLTIAGTVDPTFGAAGVTSIVWTPGNLNSARDLAVMGDDRVVTGGGSYDPATGASGAAVLARLQADGSFDATFGSGGRSIFPLPAFGGSWFSVDVASNDKVILGGVKNESVDLSQTSGNILRFRENGVIDTAFAGDGSFEYAPTSPPYIGGVGGFLDNSDRPVGVWSQVIVPATSGNPLLVRLEAGKKSCP